MRDTVTRTPGASRTSPAAAVALTAVATIATVWWLQAQGYNPCELCLKERVPFYVALPLAGLMAFAGARLPRPVLGAGYVLLAVLWIAGAALGAYHAGVEWKLWAGPTECSGAAAAPAAVGDFLKQLQTVTVVRCDEAALQVLGLSLAAWNAILSLGLAGLSLLGWRRCATR